MLWRNTQYRIKILIVLFYLSTNCISIHFDNDNKLQKHKNA